MGTTRNIANGIKKHFQSQIRTVSTIANGAGRGQIAIKISPRPFSY